MSAFDGKEDYRAFRLYPGSFHSEDWQPPKTSRPMMPPFKLTFVTSAL